MTEEEIIREEKIKRRLELCDILRKKIDEKVSEWKGKLDEKKEEIEKCKKNEERHPYDLTILIDEETNIEEIYFEFVFLQSFTNGLFGLSDEWFYTNKESI